MQGMKDKPHNDYNIKRQALLRDGFKCALTGLYDYDVWEQLRPNERGENRLSDTKAVYLFPESTQTVPKVSIIMKKTLKKTWHRLLYLFRLGIVRVGLRSTVHVWPRTSCGITLQRRSPLPPKCDHAGSVV